jgi:hypothetical protein
MTPDIKSALRLKSCLMKFMLEHVYRGDYDNPRLRPDASGAYTYKDKKVLISCQPSPRDGWLNCAVSVSLARRRLLSRTLELVLDTGYGVEVHTFRPGLWVDYVFELAQGIEGVHQEREAERQRRREDEERRQYDANFSPVDDADIFAG